MAQQGSSLQNYNNELVKCIEDLKEKREEARSPLLHLRFSRVFLPCSTCRLGRTLQPMRGSEAASVFKPLLLIEIAQVNRQIVKDEEEKAKIQNDLRMLTERLSRVNDSVARKVASRNE